MLPLLDQGVGRRGLEGGQWRRVLAGAAFALDGFAGRRLDAGGFGFADAGVLDVAEAVGVLRGEFRVGADEHVAAFTRLF